MSKPPLKSTPERIIAISVALGLIALCAIFYFVRPAFLAACVVLAIYLSLVLLGIALWNKNSLRTKRFKKIVFAPAVLVLKITPSLKSLNVVVATYIILGIGLFTVLVWLPRKIWGFNISNPAIVYILLTAISIIMTTWGDHIITRFVKLFHWKKGVQPTNLYYQKKIRYLILLIYFCSLIVFTLASLANKPLFDIERLDYALIQSFATYVAYDRLVRNYHTVAPSPDKDDLV